MSLSRTFNPKGAGSIPAAPTGENTDESVDWCGVGPAVVVSPRSRVTRLVTRSLLAGMVALTAGIGVQYWFTGPAAGADQPQRRVPVCQRPSLTASQAIDCLWPRGERAKAHRVAECESTASASEQIARRNALGRWARNGSHLGIFQMGSAEREDHGQYTVGAPARTQVRSALSLRRARGWQPWKWSKHCWGR